MNLDRIEEIELLAVLRTMLSSNNKFAEALRYYGVEPPTKISTKTGKTAFAFAKSDLGLTELLDHPDERVRALVEARLAIKTSIAETRAQRFIDMSNNGAAPVYLKYWGAEQTGRMSGGDKMNWQNLGRTVKGQIGLRDTVHAPEGYTLVVGDSANIEARTVCWIAGQEDILEKYRNGEDLYCDMAADVYGRPVTKTDKTERMLGKIAVLGLGYGMGKKKFFATVTGPQWKVDIEQAVTDRAVNIFRSKYDKVSEFWRYQNDVVIPAMADGKTLYADSRGILTTTQYGLLLPNGRTLRYPDLHQRKNEDPDSPFKTEWVFHIREGSRVIKTRTYGGHLTENICQALARIVVMDQAVEISRRYKVVMLVHDEVVCCVPEEQAELCKKFMLEVMRKTPEWATGLPLDAEVGSHKIYSQAK